MPSSSGSMGRDWFSAVFKVFHENRSSPELESLFDSANVPVVIPSALLSPNSTYRFEVTLCNFLGACSTGSHIVQRVDHAIPLVSICGPSTRSIPDSLHITLTAVASLPNCPNSSFVTYSWSVYITKRFFVKFDRWVRNEKVLENNNNEYSLSALWCYP